MVEWPSPESLERGHVVLARDPFVADPDATRPWVVVNNECHPFDGEQYVAMALTTRTWFDERVPLDDADYRVGRTPADSSIVPHAVSSLQPELVTDVVCRLRPAPVDEAVDHLGTYLENCPS